MHSCTVCVNIFSNGSIILTGLQASIGFTHSYSSRLFLCTLVHVCSLAKEHPPLEERLSPTFDLNFCVVYWLMECTCEVLRNSPKHFAKSEVEKLCTVPCEGYYEVDLCRGTYNEVNSAAACCVQPKSCMPPRLELQRLVAPLYIIVCPVFPAGWVRVCCPLSLAWALFRDQMCTHGRSFVTKCRNTWKSTPPPHFGILDTQL